MNLCATEICHLPREPLERLSAKQMLRLPRREEVVTPREEPEPSPTPGEMDLPSGEATVTSDVNNYSETCSQSLCLAVFACLQGHSCLTKPGWWMLWLNQNKFQATISLVFRNINKKINFISHNCNRALISSCDKKFFWYYYPHLVPPSKVPNVKIFYDPCDFENQVKVKLMAHNKRFCHKAS